MIFLKLKFITTQKELYWNKATSQVVQALSTQPPLAVQKAKTLFTKYGAKTVISLRAAALLRGQIVIISWQ